MVLLLLLVSKKPLRSLPLGGKWTKKRGVIDLIHFPPYVAIKGQTRAKSIEVYKGCSYAVDIMLRPLWVKQSEVEEGGGGLFSDKRK